MRIIGILFQTAELVTTRWWIYMFRWRIIMKRVAMQGTEDSGHKTADTQQMRAYPLFLSFKHTFLSSSSLPVTLVSAVGSDAKLRIKWCIFSGTSRFRKDCLSYPHLRSNLSRRGMCWRGWGSQLTEVKESCQTLLVMVSQSSSGNSGPGASIPVSRPWMLAWGPGIFLMLNFMILSSKIPISIRLLELI